MDQVILQQRGLALVRRARSLLVAGALAAAPLAAQTSPDAAWRTIESEHFRVHYTLELDELARRTLGNAEVAYERLAAELPVPRGLIDIVVADNVDFANGLATPFPSNRIIVYARPPVDELQLRNHEDWNLALVTHELTHIFHLDRVGGWWKLAQRVFGRAAPLFPNTYAPNWLIEGIAIHYETRFTRGGRLGGVEFPAAVRALALENALPPLDGIVTPRPFYPGANTPYLLGAFLVDRAVRHDAQLGPDVSMARLFDAMSARMIPWRHDANARDAVGASFTELYAAWRDSVMRSPAVTTEIADAPQLTDSDGRRVRADGWSVASPRFGPDGGLRYVANDVRRMPGLYEIAPDGTRRRIARRNSVDAFAPLGAERSLHAALDRTDPYTIRSDLYVARGARRTRLTVGERLAHPDVHPASERVVAVRTIPGATELVTLSVDDPFPSILAAGTIDRTWSEPRWSRDGTRVAAALWERGGRTSIVVLTADGEEQMRFSPRARDFEQRLAIASSPAWMPGDSLLIFVSDHEGVPMVYRGDVRTGAYDRLWSTRTALRAPDVSPDGSRLAAVELGAEGWSVVTRELPVLPPLADAPPAVDASALLPVPPPVRDTASRGRRYSPLRSLTPTWWLPTVSSSDENDLLIGGIASGRDLVGRHEWQAILMRDVEYPELWYNVAYSYARLGNPVLSVGAVQAWAHGPVTNSAGDRAGTITRQTRTFSGTAYFVRPRERFTTFAVVGAEVGLERYRTYPEFLLELIDDPTLFDTDVFPRAVASAGFSTMQRPGLSVSVEDGIALRGTYRARFRDGVNRSTTHQLIVDGSAAKSLPLPGFARHVVAVRSAFGIADARMGDPFRVGGVSGSSIELLPGLTYGDPQRTFFVRGFDPSAQRGDRAAAMSVEYRAPLTRVGRGYKLVPVFLQKLSVLAFADAGAAWCAREIAGSSICDSPTTPRSWLASAGGELAFDTALQYDVLYRFRLGVAAPIHRRDLASQTATIYLTLGSTF